MNIRRFFSFLIIISIITSLVFSANAQMIQNFDNDTLEYFAVSGSYVLVKNGKLYFEFPATSPQTISSYLYKQDIHLQKYFCLDLSMNFDDKSNFEGNILWRDYANSSLGFYNMITFSNSQMILTDGNKYEIPSGDFRLRVDGNNEKINTYVDGILINESNIPTNFKYNNPLELRIEFNNNGANYGESSTLNIDNMKFITCEDYPNDLVADKAKYYIDFGRQRIREEAYLDPYEQMTVNLKVANFSNETKTPYFIDAEGLSVQQHEILPGEVKNIEYSKSKIEVSANDKIKFLLWDDFNTLRPITPANSISNDGVLIPTINDLKNALSGLENGQIWLTKARINEMRSYLNINGANYDENFVKYWNDITAEGDSLINENVQGYGTDLGVQNANRIFERIALLSTLYAVTNNPVYADRAYKEMENAATFKDWHDVHFLDTAAVLSGLAIGYDVLGEYMDTYGKDKSVIAKAIYEKGLLPGLEIYRTGVDTWDTRSNNWNIICNAGMGMGALVIGNEEIYRDDCAEILNTSLRNYRLAMHSITSDGSWMEGLSYWGYMFNNGIDYLQMLQNAFDTNFGYEDMRGFRATGYFPVAMNGFENFYNYDDCEMGGIMISPRFFYFAELIDDYTLGKYHMNQLEQNAATYRDAIWYNPEFDDADLSNLKNDFYDNELKLLSFRDNFDDNTYLAFNAGNNLTPHSQLDMGSFVYDADGVRWFYDLGTDNYDLYEFLSYYTYKWYYYRNRAEGHNCMVFAPGKFTESNVYSAPDQKYDAEGEIKSVRMENDYSYAVMDLTPAYKDDCINYTRTLLLDKQSKAMILRDEMCFDKSTETYWFAHTSADIKILDDKNAELTIEDDGVTKKLYVRILKGDGKFTVMDAKPLETSPNPDKLEYNLNRGLTQNKNIGFTKLTIHQTYHSGENELVIAAIPEQNKFMLDNLLTKFNF